MAIRSRQPETENRALSADLGNQPSQSGWKRLVVKAAQSFGFSFALAKIHALFEELLLYAFLTFDNASRSPPTMVSTVLSVVVVLAFIALFAVACLQSHDLANCLDKMDASRVRQLRL